jgi:hypothetical protein
MTKIKHMLFRATHALLPGDVIKGANPALVVSVTQTVPHVDSYKIVYFMNEKISHITTAGDFTWILIDTKEQDDD